MMGKIRRWELPHYRARIQGYRGLGELRWKAEQKQHRLIGYFSGDVWIAVMGCTHKGKIYDPRDALETADRRRKEIESGKVKAVEYEYSY